jgi:hypothetical protein
MKNGEKNHRHALEDPTKLPLDVRLQVVEATAEGRYDERFKLLRKHGCTVAAVNAIVDSVREAHLRGFRSPETRRRVETLLSMLDDRVYVVAPDEAEVRFEELRED